MSGTPFIVFLVPAGDEVGRLKLKNTLVGGSANALGCDSTESRILLSFRIHGNTVLLLNVPDPHRFVIKRRF